MEDGDEVTFNGIQEQLKYNYNYDMWKEMTKYQSISANKPILPFRPPEEVLSDATLIMEMLRRGFAVAKMPARDLAEELGKEE